MEEVQGESDEKETRRGNEAKTELQDSGRKIWAKKGDYSMGVVVRYVAQLPEDYRVSELDVVVYMPKLNYKKLADGGMDRKTLTVLAYLTETLGAKPRGDEGMSGEMVGVRECVRDVLSKGEGVLHNEAWGHDIFVPTGRYGKKGYGVSHMYEKRILHGFSEDETAFVIICAMKAAETSVGFKPNEGNKYWLERFGVRAVIAKDSETRNEYISGFVVSGLTREETKGAVDSEAARLGTHFYALDELSRIQQVGVAMEKALQKFDRIVNKNPKNWEEIISTEVEMLKIKQETRGRGGITMAMEIWGEESMGIMAKKPWLGLRISRLLM